MNYKTFLEKMNLIIERVNMLEEKGFLTNKATKVLLNFLIIREFQNLSKLYLTYYLDRYLGEVVASQNKSVIVSYEQEKTKFQ